MLDSVREKVAHLRGFDLELNDNFKLDDMQVYNDDRAYLFNKQLHDIIFAPIPGTGQPANLIDLLSDMNLPESVSRAIHSVMNVFPAQSGADSDDEALNNTFDRSLQYGSEVDQVIDGLEKNIIDSQVVEEHSE